MQRKVMKVKKSLAQQSSSYSCYFRLLEYFKHIKLRLGTHKKDASDIDERTNVNQRKKSFKDEKVFISGLKMSHIYVDVEDKNEKLKCDKAWSL
ncbi:CLUMA_CG009471, isoform A [Clunio marinus]|uniref:CLUMA_CG009471, isoform A n=1 Tax=Clunio marinus TaxID=568069 RepID=A0A1J1I706_9DIPT|nr:CLUMA_CG009471, isoform A [Clunio marinus]